MVRTYLLFAFSHLQEEHTLMSTALPKNLLNNNQWLCGDSKYSFIANKISVSTLRLGGQGSIPGQVIQYQRL